MLAAKNCLVIGNGSSAYADDCVVIGDETVAAKDKQTAVGDYLFDEPIPDRVKQMIEQYPAEINWLMQVTLRNGIGIGRDAGP